jgi:hypothetical protein
VKLDRKQKSIWQNISPWAAMAIALLGVICYFIQAGYMAHHVLPNLDEGTYLYKGYLFATGVYRPFQDFGVWTNKMPFSFLLPGWVEALLGPGIRTGRYFAIFTAVASLIGLWFLGKRLAGNWGGTALIWLIATNSTYIEYFSMGISQVLVFFLLIWTLYLITFPKNKIIPFFLGGLVLGILITTRENMVLFLPILIGYVFWDKGWKSGLTFFGSFLLEFIGVHILYWPNILRIWSNWLPKLIDWVGGGTSGKFLNSIDLGSPFWAPIMDSSSRWLSFWEGNREMMIPLIMLLVGFIYWIQKSHRKNIEKYRLALMLFFSFILLWIGHAWASLANNYCVYCYSPYFSFFSVLGLILGVMTLAEWTHSVKKWTDWCLIGLIILFIVGCVFFSLSGNVWLQVMRTEVHRMNGLQVENATIQIWKLISDKFRIDYSVLLEKYDTVFGNVKIIVGLVMCLFASISAGVWVIVHKGKNHGASFGKIYVVSVLIIISIFNAFINWNDIVINNKGCGDIIDEIESTGEALKQYVKSDELVYWDGGNLALPLIYITGIKIFPALLNGAYSHRIGGEEQELQKYGFWNDALAESWKEEAAVLLVTGRQYQGPSDEWRSPQIGTIPPMFACLPNSNIFVLRNK